MNKIFISCFLVILTVAAFFFAAGTQAKSHRHAAICTRAKKNAVRCHARVITDDNGTVRTTQLPDGYGPKQFLGAYGLSGKAKKDQIIAIVDVSNSPHILDDLNFYSKTYGLPQMSDCPVSLGTLTKPCFQKVNQDGGKTMPNVNSGWVLETSLDVETVHAICQNCSILLVEAKSASFSDLIRAVTTAVKFNAHIISNSYGGDEMSNESAYDQYYNVPNVIMTFSAGDSGYGATYPAASPYVVAVGGTTLHLKNTHYVSETAWSGTGSGCSKYEQKSVWQKDKYCQHRTIADISADADPTTGAAIYDSTLYQGHKGWFKVGGTSLSAPLIAGMWALSGDTATNKALYNNASEQTTHDILSGKNGRCSKKYAYLCTAGKGYDGPTGLGTPKSLSLF